MVRKLGVPGREELAMGAIASNGIRLVNRNIVDALGITNDEIQTAVAEQQSELERREREYRDGRRMMDVRNQTTILVDDGLATGSSMRVAALALRKREPSHIVIAVPVAAPSVCEQLEAEADEVICAATPEPFFGVGQWYRDFQQTTDEEVRELLRRASQFSTAKAA
jgi:predicted phosphoribosyltransferase